jgi:hypothetical protein
VSFFYPAFILLALPDHKNNKNKRPNFIIALFAALQALFMAFFVIGMPTIA